ncbi:MAG: DNA-binding protein [Candidatus Thorarchaeota archaeon]
MNYRSAAQYLGVGLRTLQRYVAESRISSDAYVRYPNKVMFWRDELVKLKRGGIK